MSPKENFSCKSFIVLAKIFTNANKYPFDENQSKINYKKPSINLTAPLSKFATNRKKNGWQTKKFFGGPFNKIRPQN